MTDRSASDVILEVEDLHAEFRLRHSTVRAVDGISFSVRAGECVGLVGESGCGKSTTGLSIMKLLPEVGHVTSGRVLLQARDLLPMSEREMQQVRGNDIAMIFQDPMTSLNPTWTIGRQIAEPVRLHRGATKAQALARAVEVLSLVGMPRPEERLRDYPHQLSGGLRQRVMIAMALACEPRLLIADEPTTALDVTIQAQILDLIDELRDRLHMAVILITHDMGVIASRTDRVIVMYAGKVAEGAGTTELFSRMRHPYSEALLQAIPRLDQRRDEPLYSIPGLPPDLSHPITSCRFAPRCRYATQRCRAEDPPLAPEGRPFITSPEDHVFACFHPVGLAGQPQGEAPVGNGTGLELPTPTPQVTAGAPARELAPEVLDIEHLTKEFPAGSNRLFERRRETVKAVSDVSFSVRGGETFGLVGESGCGKSTIGRLVVGLEHPTGGSVRFAGEEVTRLRGRALRERRRDLQLMFQDPYASLDPRMRVGSIVREPLVVQNIGSRRSRRVAVANLLGEVGLSPKAAELYPHEFSGGQRQRIGLARALALNPRLIVADEPVSALDVSIQAQILNLMRALQEQHGLTYIFISHDLSVVRYIADTMGVMYLGKLVESGPSDELYAHPAHPYTAGLIEAVPVADPRLAHRGRLRGVRGELPSAINPPSGCRYRTRCPFAQDRCAEEEPTMRLFGERHLAACHFPLERPSGALPLEAAATPA